MEEQLHCTNRILGFIDESKLLKEISLYENRRAIAKNDGNGVWLITQQLYRLEKLLENVREYNGS